MEKNTDITKITEFHVRNSAAILFEAQKAEVESQDFTRIDKLLEVLHKCGKYSRSKIGLSFAYDDDTRELFEIPEVIAYIKALFRKCPHLVYFLQPDQTAIKCFLFCLSDAKIIGKVNGRASVDVDGDVFLRNIENIEYSVLKYGQEINDSTGAKRVLTKIDL